MFELFIAGRYLRAKRKQVMISVITVISVIGVAVGAMALVIALAITNGFQSSTQRALLAATAHVIVKEKTAGTGIEEWEVLARKLAAIPGVKDVSPGLYDFASASGTVNSMGVQVKGIQPRSFAPDMLRRLKVGSLEDLDKNGEPGIILGVGLAEQIGAVVGKPINLVIPNGTVTPMGTRPSVQRVRVAGIFESGMFEFDSGWAFMALGDMQRLWGYSDIVNAIELNLADLYQSQKIANDAESIIGNNLAAVTWQEQNRRLFEFLQVQRKMAVIIIGLIQLVAALNILTTLVMIVMEKHRDIAVLMSMGARAGQIRKIFIYKGAIIGSIGTLIGLVLGYSLSYFADRYQWLPLDQEFYSQKYVPFESNWTDALWIAAAAMTVSLLATIYPARSATKITPVESMRYE